MANTGVFGKLTPSGVDVIVEIRSVKYGHTCTHDFGWLIVCLEKRSQNGRSLTENSLVCCATEFSFCCPVSCKGDPGITMSKKRKVGSTRVHTFKHHVIYSATVLHLSQISRLMSTHSHPSWLPSPSTWPLIYWLFIWCFAQ